jgi:hypothetical protein
MAPAVPLNILKYNGASFNYQMREDGKNRKRLPARLRTGYVQKIFCRLVVCGLEAINPLAYAPVAGRAC